jgi:hypothetical protein
VLKTINNGSKVESLLILLSFINSDSSYELYLMKVLLALVLVMNYC